MFTLLVIILGIVFVALLVVAAMRPPYSPLSESELKRRVSRGTAAKRELERQGRLGDIQTMLRVISGGLMVATILLAVATFDWVIGIVVAVLVVLAYPALTRIQLVSRPAQALYGKLEPSFLRFVTRLHPVFSALRDTPFYTPDQYRRFDSREELAELVENAKDVLSSNERALISSTLVFRDKTVNTIMTPVSVIDFIKKEEFLGPLVLSELSALGHSRLPVIDKDIHHIVGILHLRDLLSLDIKRSSTAEEAMEQKVYYIHEADSLEHALAAFLRTRRHLFIVINDARETVGLLTLEDVIEALIGRRIVDEDDIHEDLRAVAQRESKSNNTAPGHVDL